MVRADDHVYMVMDGVFSMGGASLVTKDGEVRDTQCPDEDELASKATPAP